MWGRWQCRCGLVSIQFYITWWFFSVGCVAVVWVGGGAGAWLWRWHVYCSCAWCVWLCGLVLFWVYGCWRLCEGPRWSWHSILGWDGLVLCRLGVWFCMGLCGCFCGGRLMCLLFVRSCWCGLWVFQFRVLWMWILGIWLCRCFGGCGCVWYRWIWWYCICWLCALLGMFVGGSALSQSDSHCWSLTGYDSRLTLMPSIIFGQKSRPT